MIWDGYFGGSVLFNTSEEAIKIIKFMTSTDLRSQYGRTQAQKRRLLKFNFQDVILPQQKLLS